MNAVRYSPSRIIATLPFSNAFDAENSSPAPAWKRCRLSYPYESIRFLSQVSRSAQAGRRERRLVSVEPLGIPGWRVVGRGVLVEADRGIEPGHVDGVARALRQPLRVGVELGDGLRRRRDAGLREQVLVVVEPVDVGQQRHRAAGPVVLGVLADRRRELVDVDVVAVDVRLQIDPGAGAAEGAGVVGREGERHVRGVAPTDRGDDLVVVHPGDAVDVDVGVELLEVRDHAVEDADLALAGSEAAPDRDRDVLVRVERLRRAGAAAALPRKRRAPARKARAVTAARCLVRNLTLLSSPGVLPAAARTSEITKVS